MKGIASHISLGDKLEPLLSLARQHYWMRTV